MRNKITIAIGYCIILIAIYISLNIRISGLIDKMLEKQIIIWTLLPYVLMALALYIASISHKIKKLILNNIIILIVSGGGVYMLVDIRYIHPDPQGPIAEAIVPFLQIAAFIVLKIALAVYESDS